MISIETIVMIAIVAFMFGLLLAIIDGSNDPR